MHSDAVSKAIVFMDVKSVDVKVDVGKQFTNEQEFVVREHMLQWICTKAAKLGFSIVVGRSDNDYDKRHTFVTPRCKTSGNYTKSIWKLKRDDADSRRWECPFKLCGYLMVIIHEHLMWFVIYIIITCVTN